MRRRRLPVALVPLLAAVALGAPAVAAAQPPAPAPPPAAAADAADAARFAIEAIRVEGLRRASPRTVLAASRLAAGESYDEAELGRAVARVQRLPFVLDARFRLEKGSERGLYVLVVEAVETRRFFFGAELAATESGRPLFLDGFADGGTDVRRETLAGVRQSIGGAGEATLSLATEEGLQAAYTHYDLFGRGAVGGVAVAVSGFCCSSAVLPLGLQPELSSFGLNDRRRVQAHLAVPIRGDHAWRVEAAWEEAGEVTVQPVLPDDDIPFVFGDDLEHWSLGFGWFFDDTDDPLLPTRGRRFSAGVERLEVDYRPLDTFFPDRGPRPALDGERIGSELDRLHASGRWFLPLGLGQTVSFQARAAVGRSDAEWVRRRGVERADQTSFDVGLGAGHTLRLWRSPAEDPRPAELWIESGVEAGWESTDRQGALPNNPILRVAGDLALVYRSTWGLFRLAFGYRDLPEVD